MKSHLDLFIPTLAHALPTAVIENDMPALMHILNKAHARKIAEEPWDLLAKKFGFDDCASIPAGVLGANHYKLSGSPHWLRADLMHCMMDHHAVYMLGSEVLQLRHEEVHALSASIQALIAPQKWFLHTPTPHTWFLGLPEMPRLKARPSWQLLGKNLGLHALQGEDSAAWHRFLTEIQMLLHTHPVNQQRAKQGLPIVHTLWFWGAGELNHALPKPYDTVYTEDSAWAELAGQSGAHTVKSIENWACQPKQAILYSEVPAATYANLEHKLFVPLKRKLHRHQLTSVHTYLGDARVHHIHPWQRYYVWRRHPRVGFIP